MKQYRKMINPKKIALIATERKRNDSDWHDGDDSFESEFEFEEALSRLKDEEPILYDELKNIKDEISKTEPNIRKLLVHHYV